MGASIVKVSPEYFDSVGTRLVMGRGIGQQDIPGAPAVAVVNREFAKKLFNGRNPIGRSFGSSDKSSGDYQIVGVVEDSVYQSVRWKNHRMYFLSIVQRPASATGPIEHDESLFAGAIVLATERPINQMVRHHPAHSCWNQSQPPDYRKISRPSMNRSPASSRKSA